ncbi:MAG: META domain-containing protein [Candidatus Limnocylindrales bacterium]
MKLTAPFVIALAILATLLTACGAGSAGATTASAPAASGASADKQSGPTLTGKPWGLTAVNSKTPAFQGVVPDYQQPDYTITFNTDGTYSGNAACNQIAGTYETSGSNLMITAGASPLAFCPHSAFGSIFAHALTTASTYAVTSDTLTTTLSDGGTMTFGPVVPSTAQSSAVASAGPGASPPADLVGKVWKLTAITELTPTFQAVVPAAEQANYTIEFQADRTFKATADCNQVRGTYEVHRGDGGLGLEPGGGSITIVPGPSTLAACPPGSMGDLYLVGLGNLSSFGIEGGELRLTIRDGGKLVFGT